jgi:hypothetical protein
VGFVMCGCSDKRRSILEICVIVFTVFVLFRLGVYTRIPICYQRKDYSHRIKKCSK